MDQDNARRRRIHSITEAVSLEELPADDACRPDAELLAAEAEVARHREFVLLHSCIAKLKPDEQALIVLRHFEKKPFAEIARILQKREGSLRMRNKRALEKLKIFSGSPSSACASPGP